MNTFEIPVDQIGTCGLLAGHSTKREITAGGDRPRGVDDPTGCLCERTPHFVERWSASEALAEREPFECGHAHSLSVERIEAADGITHDKVVAWKAVEPFVTTT